MSIVSVLNQDSLKSDQCVQVSYALDSSVEATSWNYVAVCIASSGAGEYLTYSYATNNPMAQVSIPIAGYESMMENQALEIRFYDKGGISRASCPFTLTGEKVETFEYSFLQSFVYESNVIATFQLATADPHATSSSDYIGVCEMGGPEGSYFCYTYCVGARSGSLAINAGGWESSLVNKILVLRYYSANNATILESEPFTFEDGASTEIVAVAPAESTIISETEEVVISETVSSPVVVKETVVTSSSPVEKKKETPVATAPAQPKAAVKPVVASSPSAKAPSGSSSIKNTPPTFLRYPYVDGTASAKVARYRDADPSDIPVFKDGSEKELEKLRAMRPSKPASSPAQSSPKGGKKGKFLKKLAGGVASVLAAPDTISPQIENLENSLARRDQEMRATPKPSDFDSFLSSNPRPCAETASLQVGMILEGSLFNVKDSKSLFEIRDIDGPMLLLRDLCSKHSANDHWVCFRAPVLGPLKTLKGSMYPSVKWISQFQPHCDFFYDQCLRFLDRAPVPKSFFSSIEQLPPLTGYSPSYWIPSTLYRPGYWSASQMPLVDPVGRHTLRERVQGASGSSIVPDYSVLSMSNRDQKGKWLKNTQFKLNGQLISPVDLFAKAKNGHIQWNQDQVKIFYPDLESEGRLYKPIGESPLAALRNPTSVTQDSPFPWFIVWRDPPALLSGYATALTWDWTDGRVVSFDELQGMMDSGEVSPAYSYVSYFRYGYYNGEGYPCLKTSLFLEPAWQSLISACPHLPASKGRENMEFWISDLVCYVGKVTFQELEEACVAGSQQDNADSADFFLPLAAYPNKFRFDSKCWPCEYPMPPTDAGITTTADPWVHDLVPRIFQLFPTVLGAKK